LTAVREAGELVTVERKMDRLKILDSLIFHDYSVFNQEV